MRGKIRYCRELQKSYIIAAECRKDMIENYCGQMVRKSKIKGLAECEMRLIDGQREMWYDISSLQTLEQAFAVKEMGYGDLKNLIFQVIEVINETEKYLLDGRQLCFEPEYLYWDMEKGQIKLLFDFTERNEKSSLRRLAEFVLERTSHEDERAAELAYYFYDCAEKEEISVKKLEDYLEEREEEKEKEEKEAKETKEWGNRDTEIYRNRDGSGRESGQQEEMSAEEIPEREVIDRSLWEDETVKAPFSWDSRSGRILEGGLVCIAAALLSIAGFFAAGRYFILEDGEKMVWAAVSLIGTATGVGICIWGFAEKRREDKTCKGKSAVEREEEQEYLKDEAELWKQQMESEFRQSKDEPSQSGQTDGRTIYIGKSLLNREYSLVERKKGIEEEHPISSYPFLIGKDKDRVNLTVKEHTVSRIHARLLEEKGDIYVEDLHSTNGTYLNDLPLEPHEKVKLKRGDIIQFGKVRFTVR